MEDAKATATSSCPNNSPQPQTTGSSSNPPMGNPPTNNPPMANPPMNYPPIPPTANPPMAYPPMNNPPTDNPPMANPPMNNQPMANPPMNNPPAGYPPMNFPGYPGYPSMGQPGCPPMPYPAYPQMGPPGCPPMPYYPAYPASSSNQPSENTNTAAKPTEPQTAATYAPLANQQRQQELNSKPVMVIDQKYMSPTIVDLVVERKISLKEGTFGVTDLQGNVLFKVKGKMFSLHDKRVLVDAYDQPIVSFQQKLITAHRRWNVFKGESADLKDPMFTVKKSKIIQLFGTGLEVFLASNTSKEYDFRIKGSFNEGSCTIFGKSNAVVAQMRRQHNLKSMAFGRDKFAVTVYPNVDVAFVVALIVILEEINEDRSGSGGGVKIDLF